MIGKAPRKKATKKPSSMKRTGKAMAKPGSKAKKAAEKLGGASGKARDAILAAKERRKKALKGVY